jgi:hypothetical protein
VEGLGEEAVIELLSPHACTQLNNGLAVSICSCSRFFAKPLLLAAGFFFV